MAFPVFLFPPLPISAPVYIKSSPARRSLPLYGPLKVGGGGGSGGASFEVIIFPALALVLLISQEEGCCCLFNV